MRILITGGSGFIGRALVARLRSAHEIYCLVRDRRQTLPGSIAIVADLAAPLDIDSWPLGLDGIIHLAQASGGRKFPSEAFDAFSVNIAGLARLCDAAVRLRTSRIVIASTGTVYEGATVPLVENMYLAPRNYYPATKLASETLLWPYEACMAVCALRLFTPYGPGQTGRLVAQLIGRIREDRPVTLVGSEQGHLLAPTFVDDVADVFAVAIEQGWQGVYNVGAPEVLSVREMSVAIGHALGKTPRFEQQPGVNLRLFPDLTRLSAVYSLARFKSFEAGLRATLAE